MKNGLLKNLVLGLLVAGAMSVSVARADVVVTINPSETWNGYMNVFELPSNGGGYVFGSGWGTADLNATFSGSNMVFTPNTIGDPNPFWYTPSGGPGATGNKVMEANMYVEPAGSLPGVTLTFVGNVVSNTLAASHVAKLFIRDFAPDFSSVSENVIPVPASGAFSLSLATVNDPARHVQYGVQMKGPCVWFTDVAAKGSIILGPAAPVPAKATTWGRVKSMYR
ncbi:MAG: hypothetical protein HZA61_17175 [Candidatus Eisenbacteria bacterium]|uniref:PEP-CTERM sorting domain-containing protein n=1 Tax=Eiseniibacteriota bacterium TaxID=2212470 RepID=A0A933WA12_UNCEI|nr:hypothetical protein [Candidatus Eisenbacteria bacterium]